MGLHDSFARLQDACRLEKLRRTVEPIQNAIDDLNTWIVLKGSELRAKDLAPDGDEQELDENLLGVGFVACQATITHVTARAMRLATACKDDGLAALNGWGSKKSIYQLSPPLRDGGPSKLEFLNATANYFKHREEWPDAPWPTYAGNAKGTADLVTWGGLHPKFDDNLRRAALTLDNDLFGVVESWANAVLLHSAEQLRPYL